MGRRYRRSYSRRRSGGNPIVILVLFAIAFVMENWQACVMVAFVIAALVLLVRYLKSRNANAIPAAGVQDTLSAEAVPALTEEANSKQATEEIKPNYTSKASLMTDCEKAFFVTIKKIVEPEYIVQPQINLASIINKESRDRYQNELFRNIDFGILDQDYRLLVLIEINDQTHLERSRKERDQKVKAICAEAGIPLIVFWTKYGVNEPYIREQISRHLMLGRTLEGQSENSASNLDELE